MGRGRPVPEQEQLALDERRRAVQMLIPRRLTLSQMGHVLKEMGFANVDTGEPLSPATIHNDIKIIRASVHQETIQDAVDHKSAIYGEYQELLRLHWHQKNYKEVRLVLKDMRELLGTDAPSVVVVEQMERQMDMIIDRLEKTFGKDAQLWDRIQAAILGGLAEEASKGSLHIN